VLVLGVVVVVVGVEGSVTVGVVSSGTVTVGSWAVEDAGRNSAVTAAVAANPAASRM